MGSLAAASPQYLQQIKVVNTAVRQNSKVLILENCNTHNVVNIVARQTLSLSYGRCIAEFLDEESLVRLGLLDLSTCVGLRYGRHMPRVQKLFLSVLSQKLAAKKQPFIPGPLDQLDGYNHESASATMPRIFEQTYTGTGLLTCCPSPTLRASA
jgi:hypothetical protein